MPGKIKVCPINPDGKVILIVEGEIPQTQVELIVKQVQEFLDDPCQRVAFLHGWAIKIVKAESVKGIQLEEKAE